MGAFGLMGVPLFSGYVSKTLIHEGIVEYAALLAEEGMGALSLLYKGAEWIYLFSGGLTGAYMIKLYICLFWQKHPIEQPRYDGMKHYMSPLSAVALTASALLVPVLGICPNVTMDAIADFAGGFLHAAAPAHAVHYFSLTNLTGACISLTIGVLVYLLLIRPLLTKPERVNETDIRVYADLWPAWLDIEDGAYRPAIGLLLRAGGAAASLGSEPVLEKHGFVPVIRALTVLGTLVARVCGVVTDTVAYLLAKTVLGVRRHREHETVGNRVTAAVGTCADGVTEGLNQTVLRGRPVQHHFTGLFAGLWDGMIDFVSRATHTMSYGLILFALGLCATIIYMLMR